MSTKRIVGIALFGVLLIIAVVCLALLGSFFVREHDPVQLPQMPTTPERPVETVPDALDRVEVTQETIQVVVSTLSRPEIYSRDIVIETFWDGGKAVYDISVSVLEDATSLRTLSPAGLEKRIVVSQGSLYIWYTGDRIPFVGELDGKGDEHRTADEWHMMVTYEDILRLNRNDITDAGYTVYDGEDMVFVTYRSPLFGYERIYHISLDIGLVVNAEEFDETGALIYRMTAGETIVGEVDPAEFILPNGVSLID